MKNKLIIILFSAEKEKNKLCIGMLATAAALERPTELFLTGKSIFSFLNNKYILLLTILILMNYLLPLLNLNTKIAVCSGALAENKLKESDLRRDINL